MSPNDQKKLQEFLAKVDKSSFTNEPYIKRVEKPWGYELIFTRDNEPYTGKILHINAGSRLSLQVHDQKKESWFLLKGKVTIIIENQRGKVQEINMETGYGFTTHVGQKHRLFAKEESEVLEVSTPEIGNTYRLEDDYKRGTETEKVRKDPNRGWYN